ncbi:MAG: hypothetical protein ACYDG5_05045 [Dehalococcoidales bacterium]
MSKLSLNISNLNKIKKLGVPGIIGAVVLVFFLFLVIVYNSHLGLASGIQEPSFTNVDSSLAPPAVVADAEIMANELVGKNAANYQDAVNQLVGSYQAACQADIVIFFNSGGMGWNNISNTPGWEAILNGITSELESMGYRPLVLNYARSGRNFWGNIKEVIEASTRYPQKADIMAKWVEFLVDHLPNLKYIIAGESTGTVITEEVMNKLKDKTNVYSIQTGVPFWYKNVDQERTLLINNNGRGVDAFTYGNVPGMIWLTFKGWFGLVSPDENAGDILKFLKAPGHNYSWKYDSVRSEITEFLNDNFPKKN